jgi:transcriptional regulator, LysR family
MDPELLLTLLSVFEEGGVGAAARRLHRSQPAITERLQRLARLVGEPLYLRQGRRLHPTLAGEALLPLARRLRNTLAEADDLLARRRRLEDGVLRIAATNTLASYFLPEHLVAFRERHPQVQIHLRGGIGHGSEIPVSDWDLFFLEGDAGFTGLPQYYRVTPWLEDEVVTIFPPHHPLLDQDALDWADLLDQPIVWREPTSGVGQRVARAFADHGLQPQRTIEVTGVEAVGLAVSAGLGIGFVTAAALRQRPDWRVAMRRIPEPEGLSWTLYLASPEPAFRSPVTAAFLAFIADRRPLPASRR